MKRDPQVKKRKEALAAYIHHRERIAMALSQSSNLEEKMVMDIIINTPAIDSTVGWKLPCMATA